MNRFRLFFLVLIVALVPSLVRGAGAYDKVVNNCYFKLDPETYTATLTNSGSYNSYSGIIQVPSIITGPLDKNYEVVAIADEAFRGSNDVTSITLPNTIKTIGSEAFWGCSGLTAMTIPNSVTSIGSYAFSGCI